LRSIWALAVAISAIAASQAAQAADQSVVFTERFNYSEAISGSGSGALTPIGGMAATFQPITPSWGTIYETHITWTYYETFDGLSAGGGISFSYGGNASVDDTSYDGTGNGAGQGGAPGSVINFYSQSTLQDDFKTGQDSQNILGMLAGPNPFTVRWNLNTDDSYATSGNVSGTLSGIGTLSMIVDFVPAPEPSTWAMLILGVGMTGLAIRRRRRRLAVTA
jgi:hypothetical protein